MFEVSDKKAMEILRLLREVKQDYMKRAEKAVSSVGIIGADEARSFIDSGFQQGSQEINTLCFSVKHLFISYMMSRNPIRAKKFSNYVYRELFELSDDKAIKMVAITSLQIILMHAEDKDYPRKVIGGILKNLVRCLETEDQSIFDYANLTISQVEGE